MVNKTQILIVISSPVPSSYADARSTPLERWGLQLRCAKAGGFFKRSSGGATDGRFLDFSGPRPVRRTTYLVEQGDLTVLVGEGADPGLLDRTEEVLRRAFASVQEPLSGSLRLQIAIQALQDEAILEPFDIATFLAFVRECLKSGRRAKIDYRHQCRKYNAGERVLDLA